MICINMAKKLQYTYSALASEIKGGTFAPIYLFMEWSRTISIRFPT